MISVYGYWEAKNVCLWHDGTIRPWRGHKANCEWAYDGQVFYHKKPKAKNE